MFRAVAYRSLKTRPMACVSPIRAFVDLIRITLTVGSRKDFVWLPPLVFLPSLDVQPVVLRSGRLARNDE